jgi:hypothetical protein
MQRIVLYHLDAAQAVALKNNLLADGLILDQDFFWAYCPSRHDGFTTEQPRHVVFDFVEPAIATFYQLKWT